MSSEPPPPAPLVLTRIRVVPSWIDYNGHMTESRYLFACSETTDALLAVIGAGLDYVSAGHSYYTVETHLIHRGETRAGELLTGSLQILAWDEKRLHVFVSLSVEARIVATLEQMLLHVDARAGRSVPASPAILAAIAPIAEAHASLPPPAAVGRYIGQPRG